MSATTNILPSLHVWRLTRKATKETKARFRATADVEAAEALLCHSIAMGHSNLLIQRFIIAEELGVVSIDRFRAYYDAAVIEAGSEAAQAINVGKNKAAFLKSRKDSLKSTDRCVNAA